MSVKRQAIFASAPATQRGQAVQLSASPDNTQFIYCNGRTVVLRNLASPELAAEYTEHTCAATVARWSPSGYYIASGDVQGNVRIWDTINEEHILKLAVRPISSRVNDIAWDSESKRLVVVGDGKERFGHAFGYDTGSSCGDIVGHSKVANSCHIRAQRPFRAVTCSDDLTVNFYTGVPYKFQKSISDHSRFVQCVRFSPDGAFFISAGSDAKIFLYDGSTGDKLAELSDGAHTGGILAASWSPDSTRLLTSSMDMTCKIWDVAARKAVSTVSIGSSVNDQQVGNLWAGKFCLSLSLGGDLNYIDTRDSRIARTVYGHQKSITAFAMNTAEKSFYTGSYDGRVLAWSADKGLASPILGQGHTSQVSGLALGSGGKLFSTGFDDCLKRITLSVKMYQDGSVPLEAQPRALAAHGDLQIVVTTKQIVVLRAGTSKLSSVSVSYGPMSVAISPDGNEVAVGGDDMKVHLFALIDGHLTAKPRVLESNRGQITALAYSPNGKLLAAGDTDRKIMVYDTESGELKFNEWVFHSSRVSSIDWTADSLNAVSGGLDRDIYVWSTEKPMKAIAIKGAHQEGVSGVHFLGSTTVVSVGNDACVKVWNIT